MTEFDRDLRYVKQLYSKIYGQDEMSRAQRARRDFIDKYILLISQTDPTFNKVQVELHNLELEAMKRMTSSYYFK